MKSSVSRDIALTLAGLVLMVAGFIYFVYLPGRHTCKYYQRQIEESEARIGQIPVKVAELEALRDDFKQRRKDLQQTIELMPNGADIHEVIRKVADLARASNLEISRLQPLEAIDRESYQIMPFQLNLSGKFYAVAGFLRGLENLERLFTIRELSLSSDMRREPENVVGDMYFSVYVRRTDSSDFVENSGS